MENAIVKMFEFEGRPFAAFTVDGRPAILAKELGVRLGYANDGSRISKLIRKEWKDSFVEGKHYRIITGKELSDLKHVLELGTQYVPSRSPHIIVLFEEGINMVALKSDKASAVRFQQFLAEKVVPQLVRDGMFIPGRDLDSIDNFNPMGSTAVMRQQLLHSIKLLDRIDILTNQVMGMRYNYNAGSMLCSCNKEDVYISVYAKILKFEDGTYIGEKDLYRWLYSNKILMKGDRNGNKHNIPYANFSRFFSYVKNAKGEKIPHTPTMITPEGQSLFVNMMMQDIEFFKHKHIYIENVRTKNIFRANENVYF